MVIRKTKFLDENIINNLLAAIVICFTLINGAIGIDNISLLTASVIIIIFFIGVIKKKTFIYFKPFLIILFVLGIFLFSFIRVSNNSHTISYLLNFLSMGVMALLIGRQKLTIEKVIYYTEMIGMICCLIYLYGGMEQYDVSLQMGITYSMFPVFCASIIELLYIKKHKLVAVFLVVSMFIFFVRYATRGLWLLMAVSILIYVYILIGKSKVGKEKIFVYGTVTTIMFLIVFLVIQNLREVLSFINTFFYEFTGNRIYAIDKAIYLINSGNLGNGRDDLLQAAMNLFEENMIIGNGIGSFEAVNSGAYVHNILGQGLCEMGVLFLIPFCLIVINIVRRLLTENESMVSKLFFLLLVSSGLIMLLYSSVYWRNYPFWLLLGYILRPCHVNKKKV